LRIGARYRRLVVARSAAKPGRTPTINNRRARYDYLILDTVECGIVLAGSEVKSLREGRATLQDSYARVIDGEMWLHGMHIAPYAFARAELDPVRPRKLLLHRRQIDELTRATAERGITLVPLRAFFRDGRVKVDLAVGRGKRSYDKRRTIAERDARRDIERALKGQRD
jgi:SsrA-binding protein